MNVDKRMFFVRNIGHLKDKETEILEREFEIITDANIIGGCDYGPYNFMMWDHTQKRSGEKRKLCMRVREKHFTKPEEQPVIRATENGLYHGGYIVDELVALASLFLRRRIELGKTVRLGNTPLIVSKRRETMGLIDKEIVEGNSNLGELKEWFDLAVGLDEQYHQSFILAAVFYHKAVLIIEEYPDVAYINLISSIEALSRDYDLGEIPIAEFDKALAKSIGLIEEDTLRKRIEKQILGRQKFLSRRFEKFIIDHIEEEFWDYREEKALVIKWGQAKK